MVVSVVQLLQPYCTVLNQLSFSPPPPPPQPISTACQCDKCLEIDLQEGSWLGCRDKPLGIRGIEWQCHLTFLIFLPQLKMLIISTHALLPLVVSLYINYCQLNHQKNSFPIMGANIWNSIPQDMRQLQK